MSAILIMLIGMMLLYLGYIGYGRWLAGKMGVDEDRVTPAHELEDGRDYVPASAQVLMGHHFSSIAGAGPINGPIQAAVFGWVPVFLWIVLGGIFFGGVHDFGALLASVRSGGHSIGEVVSKNVGRRAKQLFLIFAYFVLILIIASFSSIVAGAFASEADSLITTGGDNSFSSTAATASMLFIGVAILFGFVVYRRGAPIGVATVAGLGGIVACILTGLGVGINLGYDAWMLILGVYILLASVTPVWILLQPRDYLSSFLLYAMMAAAVVGIFGCGPDLEIPAFTGFHTRGGFLFPALFTTVACGAVSGFHSLVGSGTTAKQLDSERDALPIGYGAMLIESGLAIISLVAVGYVWTRYSSGELTNPTEVFAAGIASMLRIMGGGSQQVYSISYALMILALSAFALTSLDTAARLARYMFQEFWLRDGESYEELTGVRRLLAGPLFSTAVTVVIGIALGFGGYEHIWPLFGAANQLLAALAMLAVAVWLRGIGRSGRMFYFPMCFMLAVTLCSLGLTIWERWQLIAAGAGTAGAWFQLLCAAALLALALLLIADTVRAVRRKRQTVHK